MLFSGHGERRRRGPGARGGGAAVRALPCRAGAAGGAGRAVSRGEHGHLHGARRPGGRGAGRLRAPASVERVAARRGLGPAPTGEPAAQQDPAHGGHPGDLARVRRRVPAPRRAPPRPAPRSRRARHGGRRPRGARRRRVRGRHPLPRMTDVLIVGSGPGGVNAAAPLVAAGRRVVLLAYGNQQRRYAAVIPHQPFSELRRTDAQQHRYFLGDHFEGIPLGPVRVGAQLTPPRLHILADAAERMPVHTDGFAASMSLARGGLGAGWSAGVFPFTDDELRDMGLGFDELGPHYDAVAERIGVCGAEDDLQPFLPESPSIMPPLELDSNAEVVLTRYLLLRAVLKRAGFFLGRTRLAACTRRHRERRPYAYLDLASWADTDRSASTPPWARAGPRPAPPFTSPHRRS